MSLGSAAVVPAPGFETEDTGVKSRAGFVAVWAILVPGVCWNLCCCLSLHLRLITKLNVSF